MSTNPAVWTNCQKEGVIWGVFVGSVAVFFQYLSVTFGLPWNLKGLYLSRTNGVSQHVHSQLCWTWGVWAVRSSLCEWSGLTLFWRWLVDGLLQAQNQKNLTLGNVLNGHGSRTKLESVVTVYLSQPACQHGSYVWQGHKENVCVNMVLLESIYVSGLELAMGMCVCDKHVLPTSMVCISNVLEQIYNACGKCIYFSNVCHLHWKITL